MPDTDRHTAVLAELRLWLAKNREDLEWLDPQYPAGALASVVHLTRPDTGLLFRMLLDDVDRLTAALRTVTETGQTEARERDAAVARADVAASAVRQTAEWWAAEYRLLAERCAAAEGETQLPETWRRLSDLEAREAAAVARAERAESALRDCQMSLAQSEALNLGHEGHIAGLEKRLAELRQYLAGSWRRVGAFGVTYCTYCNANGGRHRKDCPAASPAEVASLTCRHCGSENCDGECINGDGN